MTRKTRRVVAAEAAELLKRAQGQGLHMALIDFLETEMADTHDEMESALDTVQLWRAQGRAGQIRRLLTAITTGETRTAREEA